MPKWSRFRRKILGWKKKLEIRTRATRIFLLQSRAKEFFRFDKTAVAIPFFYPLGWAMVGLGDLEHASDGVFVAAYAMFVSSFVWSLGLWLTSDVLAKRNPQNWLASARKNKDLKKSRSSYLKLKYGICLCMIAVLYLSMHETSIIRYNKRVSSLEGVLYPSNEPTPRPCGGPPKFSVYMPERNFSLGADRLPLPLFRSMKTQKLVAQLSQLEDGSLDLSMDIMSDDQKIVVSIKDNKYVVNHNNYLQFNRRNDARDESTLSVTDQSGKEVLRVHYLNRYTFSIMADLKVEGRELDTAKLGIINGCITVTHGRESAGAIAF